MKEKELISKCKKNDSQAQKWVYDHFADEFFKLAVRYVKTQPEAEDVLIMAFTKIFNRVETFEYQGDGSFKAWMRKIVINESLMWLRRQGAMISLERVEEVTEESDLSQLTSLDAADIHKMITRLPTGYRTVFNLNVIEGYNHQEIATMLSITESTSRTQLHKAKAALKKMLTNEGFDYGT